MNHRDPSVLSTCFECEHDAVEIALEDLNVLDEEICQEIQ